MRRGGRILVLLGIVLGIITAGGTFLVLSTSQPQQQPIATRSVVVALQNIPARTEISADTVGKAEWPESVIPPGALANTEDVVGKLSLVAIYQGQLILPPMVIDKSKVKETRSNASFLVPENKVAIAFPVTQLSGIAGALQPGDTVDLLLTLTPPQPTTTVTRTTAAGLTGTEGQAATQIMLQDVLVIQVGLWPSAVPQERNAPAANVVTFVLERQDALALKSAREVGIIELALRRAGDHKTVTTEPVTLEYLNRRFNFKLAPAIR